jgi:hypothetical protein
VVELLDRLREEAALAHQALGVEAPALVEVGRAENPAQSRSAPALAEATSSEPTAELKRKREAPTGAYPSGPRRSQESCQDRLAGDVIASELAGATIAA